MKLFQSTNVSVAEPYAKKFSRTKNVCKAYFAIFQHSMGDDVINRAEYKAYLALEVAKYCGKSKKFTYKTYVLIFQKNMCILSKNDEEMQDARAVQKFLVRHQMSLVFSRQIFCDRFGCS